jgi:AmmeMemoRadiSam system protein B
MRKTAASMNSPCGRSNHVYAYHAIRERRISMCGLIPAVVVMQALAEIGRLRSVERVNYATSGDVTGDRRRVVGYAGLRLFS